MESLVVPCAVLVSTLHRRQDHDHVVRGHASSRQIRKVYHRLQVRRRYRRLRWRAGETARKVLRIERLGLRMQVRCLEDLCESVKTMIVSLGSNHLLGTYGKSSIDYLCGSGSNGKVHCISRSYSRSYSETKIGSLAVSLCRLRRRNVYVHGSTCSSEESSGS